MVIRSLIDQLLSTQNRDGGWAYVTGKSWTEPTALAILALVSAGFPAPDLEPAKSLEQEKALERARTWLRRAQRADGGWPPTLLVQESTAVTSSAVLAISTCGNCEIQTRRGVAWILQQSSAKPPLLTSLARLLLHQPEPPSAAGGVPWFPGTAAWVAPTAMKLLVLSNRISPEADRNSRGEIEKTQDFLLLRRLPDGGWNHGGSYNSSETVASYPEITGLALLALKGVGKDKLRLSLALAESFFQNPGSLEAWSWLYMALMVHGLKPAATPAPFPPWTSRDLSLLILALTAGRKENPLTGALHA